MCLGIGSLGFFVSFKIGASTSPKTCGVQKHLCPYAGEKPTDGGKVLPPVEKDTTEIVKEAVNSNESMKENLEQAVSRLIDYALSSKRELRFSMDESTGRSAIAIIDRAIL